MQSSYKVIKGTVIESNAVIEAPDIEKIYSNLPNKDDPTNQEESEQDTEELEKKIEEIYNKIKEEANLEKDRIVKEAQDEARNILEKANKEIVILKEETIKESKEYGYQEGYAIGYKDGYDRGIDESRDEGSKIVSEADEIRKDAQEHLLGVHKVIEDFIHQNEKNIISLAVNIARQIINAELTINPDSINSMAEKMLSKLVDKKQIIIKVNPRDFNFVKKKKEELSIYVEDSNNLLIVADSSITPGSLKAETSSGFIDGDIDSQLDIMLKELLGD